MSTGILQRELLLIRHGESLANAARDGDDDGGELIDSVLSEKGEAQARALGEFYKSETIDTVFASGLKRAVQTAGALASKQANNCVNILPYACEIGMPVDYPGQSIESLSALRSDVSLRLADGVDPAEPFSVPDPTPGDFEERYFERAKRVLDYMDDRFNGGERVALVSHAGFLTYIIFYLLGFRDMQPKQDFRLSNTGVTRILFYEPDTNKYGDVIFDCVNDRSHLL